MPKKDPSLHKGHRERMKKQFLENGFNAFNEHQKLEFLLFYAQPQHDTNELAHRLLDECGGRLYNVFDASIDRLISVDGVSKHTAAFLKMLPEMASYYLSSKQLAKGDLIVENLETLCYYYEGLFVNICKEEVHAAAVTGKLELVNEKKISEGNFDSVTFSPRKIFDFAEESKCNNIIIAHNHPQGSPFASKTDVAVTKRLVEIFRPFDINIIDHIIVGKGGSHSLRSSLSAKKIWGLYDEEIPRWNAGMEI